MRSLYSALDRRWWLCCLTAVLPLVGCGINSTLDTGQPTEALESLCGNGKIDRGKVGDQWVEEQCDGKNLDNETCESLGEGKGKLSCGPACFFDVSLCEGPPQNQGAAGYGASNISGAVNTAGAGGAAANTGLNASNLASLAQMFLGGTGGATGGGNQQATGGTSGTNPRQGYSGGQTTGGTSGNQQATGGTGGRQGRRGQNNQASGGSGGG